MGACPLFFCQFLSLIFLTASPIKYVVSIIYDLVVENTYLNQYNNRNLLLLLKVF